MSLVLLLFAGGGGAEAVISKSSVFIPRRKWSLKKRPVVFEDDIIAIVSILESENLL